MVDCATRRRGESKLRILLDTGVDSNTCDSNGNAALQQAIELGNAKAVPMLIDAGADVNAVDSDGKTMLQLAESISAQSIVQYLIDAGAE